jgi:hypothetical protein
MNSRFSGFGFRFSGVRHARASSWGDSGQVSAYREPRTPNPEPRKPTFSPDFERIGRLIWRELPVMMLINLLVTLAAGLIAVTVVSLAIVAPLLAAVLLGPVWIGAIAVAERMLAGDAVGMRDLLAAIRRHARTGIGLAAVPAIVATLLAGSIGILAAHEEQRWLLAPIAVDATVLCVLLLGCVTAFPLAVIGEARGMTRWIAALALAGHQLVAVLGVAALLVLLAFSVQLIGPWLVMLAAGPLALLCVAVTRVGLETAGRP